MANIRKLIKQIVAEQDLSDDEIKQMADYVFKNKNDPAFTKNSPLLPYASNSGQVESGLRKKLTDPEKGQATAEYIRKRMGVTQPAAEPAKATAPTATQKAPEPTKTTTPQKVADTITKTAPTAKGGNWADTRAKLGFSAKQSVSDNPELLAAYNAWKEKQ